MSFRVRLRTLSDTLLDYDLTVMRSTLGATAKNVGTSAKPPIS